MLFKTSTILALAVAPYALAQNTAVELQSIIAQFKNAGLTPSPITTFNPSALLAVTYGSSAIDAGKPQTVDAVKPQPQLTLTPVTNSADVSASATYTVAMIDADYAGASQAEGQTRHWLVNGVKATGTSTLTLDTNAGTNITAYGGPFPAEGSGAHRYMLLVLAQPSTFTAPATPAANSPIEKFDFEAYVKSAGLGNIVAGSYITVEQGTSTVSAESTEAVNTATLSVPSTAAASGSATGSRSGSATGSATAPASSSTNAASGRVVEWGMLGAAALLGAIAL